MYNVRAMAEQRRWKNTVFGTEDTIVLLAPRRRQAGNQGISPRTRHRSFKLLFGEAFWGQGKFFVSFDQNLKSPADLKVSAFLSACATQSDFGFFARLIFARSCSTCWCLSADSGVGRSAQSLRQRRVLIVEDDCMIASTLTDDLNEFGLVVIGPANNLAEATAIASTAALDCALIDIALGDESALPVAQILSDRHIPFVFMTGASESAEVTFQEVPVLLKPFTFEELRLALQRILSD